MHLAVTNEIDESSSEAQCWRLMVTCCHTSPHELMEGEPVDSTDKDTIMWELVVPTEAGLDTQCHSPPLPSDGPGWDVDFEPMTLPVKGERARKRKLQTSCFTAF